MKKKKNYVYIGIIFFVTCIILSSLFLKDRYYGHDTIFHVSNIIRLSKSISLDHLFGATILKYNVPNFSYGLFGYGIGLFYPRMPHLTAAYVYLLLGDIYLSMKVVYFITTLLSGIFAYFLSDKIYKNKNIALISSLIYIIFPYHICEIYIRDAFAENFMFMTLPMIFLGLYNLKDSNYDKFYVLFILGYIIGMNSHLVSMFFYTFFIGIFILYYRKEFFKKDKFLALIKSAIIVTIVMLPCVVTLLEHKSLDIYRVYTSTFASVNDVSILEIKDLYSQEAMYDDIMPYVNICSIILFIATTLGLFFSKKDKNINDKKIFLLLIFLIINFLCSNIIWDNVPSLLLSIQFPWRLLVLMALLISLYAPGILSNNIFNKIQIKQFKYVYKICVFLLCMVLISEGYRSINYYSDREVAPEVALNSVVSFGYSREYFPKIKFPPNTLYASNYFPTREYAFVSSENVLVEILYDNLPSMEFRVTELEKEATIEIPRTFYLGYKLVDENNKNIKLECSHNGLLKAVIKENGVYKLSYDKTKNVKIVEIIRLITIFIIGVVLVVKVCKRKKLQY